MPRAKNSEIEDRWDSRPGLAAFVRLVTVLVPLAASTLFALFAGSLLPPASSRLVQFVTFAIVAVASTGVLLLVDRVARRLLPLAALLNLSIVFPDQAPSRYKVARNAAGVRSLQARVERARQLGVEDEPTKAAALILELVTALQHHDRRTRGHSERVHLFTEMLAVQLDLSEDDRDRLRWAALVHDVGKLTVPEEILNKPSAPEPDEWERLRSHPAEGAQLCRALQSWMGEWWLTIEQHHEHYDGSGYPRGLAGKDISLGARIVSVADSFEVMTAARSYKKAMSAAAGREELSRCAGTQFDPDIVRAFLTISLGRLRLALGPLAWFAQFPALEGVIRASNLLRLVGGLAAAATTAVLVGAPTHAGAPEPATPPPPPVQQAEDTRTVAAVEERSASPEVPPVLVPDSPPILEFDPVEDVAPDPGAPAPPTSPSPPPPAAPAPDPTPDPTPPTPTRSPSPSLSPSPSPSPSPTVTPTPTPEPSPTPSLSPPPLPPPPPLPNTAPVPVPDVASTNEDTAVVINVLANDLDADGDPLTTASATNGARGTVVINGDDTVTYTPDADSNGIDSFAYQVSDGTATVASTVVVTVAAVNDAPTFVAGGDQNVAEDAGPQIVLGWATAMSPGPADETAQVTSFTTVADDPSLFTAGPTIDSLTGLLTYTPAPDANGVATITVTLSDTGGTANGGSDTSAAVTFDITITPQPDDPVAVPDSYVVQAGDLLTVPSPGVLANDTDPDDDPLVVSGNTAPVDGILTLNPDGSFTYAAPPAPGDRTFTYTVDDGTGRTDVTTVTITVQAAPVTSSVFFFGISGSAPDTYALRTSAPPFGGPPEPDHDGDGDPGLSINNSSRDVDDNDPTKYQHWTYTFAGSTTYDGQARLTLWSSVEDFDDDDDGHYAVWLHDCASDGTDCNLVLETDAHIANWNGGIANWVFKELALGSVNHTFTAGRMLRVRLMFGHNPMWVQLQDRPTRLILDSS